MSTRHSRPGLEQVTTPPQGSQTVPPRPQRILSCVQCHQRKVKCDRKFPCANCLRAGVQCVPAHSLAPRPRRRRFPERELLDRLRHYEAILRENNINFEPLHPNPTAAEGDDATSESSKEKTAVKLEVVDLWHAISQATLPPEVSDEDSDASNPNNDPDSVSLDDDNGARKHDTVIKKAFIHRFQNHGSDRRHNKSGECLLFGQPDRNIDLSASYPGQAQIFRLWQIYLDNVNPLLKVTHIPTLQPRILDAVSNPESVNPSLQALMFSIYCLSVSSLTQDECFTHFQLSRIDLLAIYQPACRQALLNCSAWRSSEVDSLTALYFYLLSVASRTDPRSLSSMLAVLIRTAQRVGIHIESTNTKHTALKAEMSRRLWWSLVLFDHRICELCDDKTTTLTPVWDCHTPLNVNDFELRPEMKNVPAVHDKPTEALFVTVRSELADSIRHCTFHVNFANPSLNAIAQPRAILELTALEKTIEDKYLTHCNSEHPLHFMTIWTTRATLARNRLLEHYSRRSTISAKPTDAERRTAFSSALSMLGCDTILKKSSLVQRYLWFVDLHFPALAYIHLLNGLIVQPSHVDADKAWDAMSDNYEALTLRRRQLSTDEELGVHFLLVSFSRVILTAWDAREASLKEQNEPMMLTPRIVSDIRNNVMQMTSSCSLSQQAGQCSEGQRSTSITDDFSTLDFPMNQGSQNITIEEPAFADISCADFFPNTLEQPVLDVNMDQFLSDMGWRWVGTQDW